MADECENLCRLCIDGGGEAVIDIDGRVGERINSCLPVKVDSSDDLPHRICKPCLHKVDTFYEFTNTCRESERRLIHMIRGEGAATSPSKTSNSLDRTATFVKQEEVDVVVGGSSGGGSFLQKEEEDPDESKSYLFQQRFVEEDESVSLNATSRTGPDNDDDEDEDEEEQPPPPKRAKRTAALKAAIALDQNSDDDLDDDLGEAHTKTEDQTDDSDDNFLVMPSTSGAEGVNAADQPGPSTAVPAASAGRSTSGPGTGADPVEAPVTRIIPRILPRSTVPGPRPPFLPQIRFLIPRAAVWVRRVAPCCQRPPHAAFQAPAAQRFVARPHPFILPSNVPYRIRLPHGSVSGGTPHVIAGVGPQPPIRPAKKRPAAATAKPIRQPGRFICDSCGKLFDASDALALHKKEAHSCTGSQQCHVCGRTISRRFMPKHLRVVHEGIKPYRCPTCGENFTQRETLVVHTRTHTGERPFVCGLCGEGHVSSAALNAHRRKCGRTPKKRKPREKKAKVKKERKVKTKKDGGEEEKVKSERPKKNVKEKKENPKKTTMKKEKPKKATEKKKRPIKAAEKKEKPIQVAE